MLFQYITCVSLLFQNTAIPLETLAQNPMVSMVLTSYGGHIAFLEGMTIHKSNFMERLFFQFAKGVFDLVDKDKLKEIVEECCS